MEKILIKKQTVSSLDTDLCDFFEEYYPVKETDERVASLTEALKLCVTALYEAIAIAPVDRLPRKAGDAIQQAQAILGL